MSLNYRSAGHAGAICAFIIGLAGPATTGQAQESPGGVERGAAAQIAQRANAALGLAASDVIALDLDRTPGLPVLALVPVQGQPVVLHLEPWSVRDASYQVLQQAADGSLVPVEAGPERTLRGSLLGVPGSAAAGSMLEDGLHAMIRFADGETVWIEPIAGRVAGADVADHVVYLGEDVIEDEQTCGTTDALRVQDAINSPMVGGGVAGTDLCTTQLACDADFEYFQDWGSLSGVEDRINLVINTVNVQYERDVDITHVITAIIVRAFEPDPYSSTDAVTLLNQFRDHWNANQGNITRDMAQLFTGKEINSSTIGIAWLNAVCTTFGYSVVQSDFNGNFACATDLSAHELGHNWGADHCTCTSYTMNPFITCANVFHPTFSIPEIISFRNSRPCIDCAPVVIQGACCLENGVCVLKTPANCAGLGGTYQGDGTDCLSTSCPQPDTGACCFSDGTCSDETSSGCASLGGTFEGVGTDCATFSCPQPPTGACCFSDGTCSDETSSGCASLGGTFEGTGTDCATFSCPQPPTGACCFPDGSCSNETSGDCASLGGTFEGDGTNCGSANCPQPPTTGACCFPDGSCSNARARTRRPATARAWAGCTRATARRARRSTARSRPAPAASPTATAST
ncbi:MAG: M12 family metallo-peptidase [Planctomycetota bacterium]|jgi:hypothetical protein